MSAVKDRPLFKNIPKFQSGGMVQPDMFGIPNLPVKYDPEQFGKNYQAPKTPKRLGKLGRNLLAASGILGVGLGAKDTYDNIKAGDYGKALLSAGSTGLGVLSMLPQGRALALGGKLGKTAFNLAKGKLGRAADKVEELPGLVLPGAELITSVAGSPREAQEPTYGGPSVSQDSIFIQKQIDRLGREKNSKISGDKSNRQRQIDYLRSLNLNADLSLKQKKLITKKVNQAILNDNRGNAPDLNTPINYLQLQQKPVKVNLETKNLNKQEKDLNINENNVSQDGDKNKSSGETGTGSTGTGNALNKVRNNETREQNNKQRIESYEPGRLNPSGIVDALKKARQEELVALEDLPQMRDMLPPREKRNFDEFYNKMMAGTQSDEMTTRLLYLKLGAGMMSGKTRQTGFSGLADVFGQALDPVVDEAMRIREREINNKRSLASQFYALEEEDRRGARADEQMFITDELARQREKVGIATKYDLSIAENLAEYEKLNAELDYKYHKLKVDQLSKQDNRTYNVGKTRVPADNVAGYAFKDVAIDTQSEEYYEMKPEYDDKGNFVRNVKILIPADQRGETPKKPDQKNARLRTSNLNNSVMLNAIINDVLQAKDNELGFTGGIRLTIDNFLGGANSLGKQVFGIDGDVLGNSMALDVNGNLSSEQRQADERVINLLRHSLSREVMDGYSPEENKLYVQEFSDILKSYNKEIAQAQKNIKNTPVGRDFVKSGGDLTRLTQDERSRLVALEMARVRAKYILANALKGEDRLTQANINDAGNLTDTFAFSNPETIREQFSQIKEQNDTIFKQNILALHDEDQSSDFFKKMHTRYGTMDFWDETKFKTITRDQLKAIPKEQRAKDFYK